MASKLQYENEIADINMTPFVDIVLVILVIFMVTATFVTQGKIPLNLPKATQQDLSKDDIKPITISLSAEGAFYYNDEAMSLEAIETHIAQLQNPKIMIRSDAKTPFEFVVQIIDTCKKHNINAFAIQTTKVEP